MLLMHSRPGASSNNENDTSRSCTGLLSMATTDGQPCIHSYVSFLAILAAGLAPPGPRSASSASILLLLPLSPMGTAPLTSLGGTWRGTSSADGLGSLAGCVGKGAEWK